MLRQVLVFWRRNGVCGLILEHITIIRGGHDNIRMRYPHSESNKNGDSFLSAEQEKCISNIANDPRVSPDQRKKILGNMEKTKRIINSQLRLQEQYIAMLAAANNHPMYSQFKRKLPFLAGSFPMFS